MILQLNHNATIENLRNYPSDVVEKLRSLLAAGARAYPDPHRKKFYDLENGSRMFYIHISPTGSVWLLASWMKTAAPMVEAQPRLVPKPGGDSARYSPPSPQLTAPKV